MKFRVYEYDELGQHREIETDFPESSVVPLVDFPGYNITTVAVSVEERDTVNIWVRKDNA